MFKDLKIFALTVLCIASLIISVCAFSATQAKPRFPTFFNVDTPYGETFECTSDGINVTCDFMELPNG